MTILDDRAPARPLPVRVPAVGGGRRPDRPSPARPPGAPRDLGRGIKVSRAVHPGRPGGTPVSTAATVALAAAAALITLWLGALGQAGGVGSQAPAELSGSLAVVRVQAGETLQALAVRVAPGLDAGRVMAEIRDLNGLESVAVQAGQTLIAPVG